MKRTILATGVLGAAVLLTACGGDSDSDGGDAATEDEVAFTDRTGAEMAQAAKDAMAGLESVSVQGDITNEGQAISLDLALSSAGDCTGSITLQGSTVELLGADGTVWFKPDETFWTATLGEQAPSVMAAVGDKWVLNPPDEDGFNQFCDVDDLLEEMIEGDDDGTYEAGEITDVDGVEAIAVTNVDAEDGDSVGYVQTEGDHFLLKMERTDGDNAGLVTFSDFNVAVDATAPAADDVFDLATLE